MAHTNGLATTWTTGQSSMSSSPCVGSQLLRLLSIFKPMCSSYLGTPKILHSDNGREFVNEIVASVCKEWPGEVTIVQRMQLKYSKGKCKKVGILALFNILREESH